MKTENKKGVCIKQNKKAFTLIELLVVVLIIGILAAIALPKYQKAVWKSKNVQLKTVAASIGQAQEAYHLANGSWSGRFDMLDIGLPLESGQKTCSYMTKGGDPVRKGKDFEVLITSSNLQNEGNITIVWTEGPYKCDGFFWDSNTKKLVCRSGGNDGFCTKVENGTRIPTVSSVFVYDLP